MGLPGGRTWRSNEFDVGPIVRRSRSQRPLSSPLGEPETAPRGRLLVDRRQHVGARLAAVVVARISIGRLVSRPRLAARGPLVSLVPLFPQSTAAGDRGSQLGSPGRLGLLVLPCHAQLTSEHPVT